MREAVCCLASTCPRVWLSARCLVDTALSGFKDVRFMLPCALSAPCCPVSKTFALCCRSMSVLCPHRAFRLQRRSLYVIGPCPCFVATVLSGFKTFALCCCSRSVGVPRPSTAAWFQDAVSAVVFDQKQKEFCRSGMLCSPRGFRFSISLVKMLNALF